jgi:hypothetical protein
MLIHDLLTKQQGREQLNQNKVTTRTTFHRRPSHKIHKRNTATVTITTTCTAPYYFPHPPTQTIKKKIINKLLTHNFTHVTLSGLPPITQHFVTTVHDCINKNNFRTCMVS